MAKMLTQAHPNIIIEGIVPKVPSPYTPDIDAMKTVAAFSPVISAIAIYVIMAGMLFN